MPFADPADPAARVLSFIAVANGPVKDCELRTLEELDAFSRLGVSRRRFLHLTQACLDDLCGRDGLELADLLQLDQLLDEVHDRHLRLLVCRLAAALVTADGHVCQAERTAYDHMLLRWRLLPSEITRAIRQDAMH